MFASVRGFGESNGTVKNRKGHLSAPLLSAIQQFADDGLLAFGFANQIRMVNTTNKMAYNKRIYG